MKTEFIDSILKIDSPWLFWGVSDESTTTNFAFNLHMELHPNVTVLRLRGGKMKNLASFFDESAAVLQFPYYFGENWNAFDECIKDLDWLDTSGYVLVVFDADELFSQCPNVEEEMETLLRILESAALEWSEAIDLSSAWGRSSRPFRVIFQTTQDKEEIFRLRVSKADQVFSKLSIK